MKYWVFFLAVTVIIFVNIEEVSAKIFYPTIDFRLTTTPTFCTIDPHDDVFSDEQKELFLNITENAVLHWKEELQKVEANEKSIWNIEHAVISSKFNIPNNCDVVIFYAKSNGGAILGKFIPDSIPPRIEMNVFPEESLIVKTNVGTKYYQTLIHEIGHALGLGHYVSDQQYQMTSWIKDSKTPPSIMVPIQNNNPSIGKITPIDVQKVREIYGGYGFYAFSEYIPQHIAELPDISEPLELPIEYFEELKISQDIISVKSYEKIPVKISGKILKDEFQTGQTIVLIKQNPDKSTDVLRFTPTKTGFFEATLFFDRNSSKGVYSIEPLYKNTIQKNMEIEFQVLDYESAENILNQRENEQTPIEIPTWVKNNARWFAENQIGDKDFKLGIKFMIDNQIIQIPNLPERTSEGTSNIPEWVKNNARWWAQNQISNEDFVKGIEYLVKNGIIQSQ